MNIKVEKFMELLGTADIVMVDDGPMLTDWEVAPREDSPENEVIRFSWESEGYSYSVIFTEEGIEGVRYDPVLKAFFLEDDEGQETKLNLGNYKSLDVDAEDWK